MKIWTIFKASTANDMRFLGDRMIGKRQTTKNTSLPHQFVNIFDFYSLRGHGSERERRGFERERRDITWTFYS